LKRNAVSHRSSLLRERMLNRMKKNRGVRGGPGVFSTRLKTQKKKNNLLFDCCGKNLGGPRI
jgi:hypothetical protein